MNKKQRRVLITAAMGVAASLLYVPVKVPVYVNPRFTQTSLQYHWLFRGFEGNVDILLLLVQWAGICLIAGLAYLLFRE